MSDALRDDLDISVRLTHSPYHRWRLKVLRPAGAVVEEKQLSPIDALAFVRAFYPELEEAARQCATEDAARAESALAERQEQAKRDAARAIEAVLDLERTARARREELEALK